MAAQHKEYRTETLSNTTKLWSLDFFLRLLVEESKCRIAEVAEMNDRCYNEWRQLRFSLLRRYDFMSERSMQNARLIEST